MNRTNNDKQGDSGNNMPNGTKFTSMDNRDNNQECRGPVGAGKTRFFRPGGVDRPDFWRNSYDNAQDAIASAKAMIRLIINVMLSALKNAPYPTADHIQKPIADACIDV
jgi:hypothetical protein